MNVIKWVIREVKSLLLIDLPSYQLKIPWTCITYIRPPSPPILLNRPNNPYRLGLGTIQVLSQHVFVFLGPPTHLRQHK